MVDAMKEYWNYPVIGIGGYAESGKDAFADILEEFGREHGMEYGYFKRYMSYPLEQALLTLNPIITAAIHFGVVEYDDAQCKHCRCRLEVMDYKTFHGLVGYDNSKKNTEVRRLLQLLGTEIGRNMFDQNVWANLVEKEVRSLLELDYKVSVTGIRFHNEMYMVRHQEGLSVWIDRGGKPVNSDSSDNTLGPDDFDVIVDNRGTLEDLKKYAEVFFLDKR